MISHVCLCLLALFALSGSAQAEQVMQVGEKDSYVFNDTKYSVEDGIVQFQVAHTRAEDVDALTKLARMRSEWLVNCYDLDQADVVEWNRNPATGVVTYKYSCFKPTDPDRAQTYVYVLDATGVLTDFSHLEAERVADRASERRVTLRIVVRETLAATAAAAIAVALARAAFPGQVDKKLHAGASSLLASGFSAVAYHLYGRSPKEAAIIGAASSCAIGLAKEVADRYVPGHNSSKEDLLADSFGCVSGSLGFFLTFQFD